MPDEPIEADAPAAPGPDDAIASPSLDDVAQTYLSQGELALAASLLLPRLEAAAQGGDTVSRLAATLIRTLMQEEAAPVAVPPIPDDLMAAAFQRLTAQIRRQEAQIEQLHSMLETVL